MRHHLSLSRSMKKIDNNQNVKVFNEQNCQVAFSFVSEFNCNYFWISILKKQRSHISFIWSCFIPLMDHSSLFLTCKLFIIVPILHYCIFDWFTLSPMLLQLNVTSIIVSVLVLDHVLLCQTNTKSNHHLYNIRKSMSIKSIPKMETELKELKNSKMSKYDLSYFNLCIYTYVNVYID